MGQLQGDQSRLAIVVLRHHLAYGRDAKDRVAWEEEAVRQAAFFDFSLLPAVIAAAPADGFRHYAQTSRTVRARTGNHRRPGRPSRRRIRGTDAQASELIVRLPVQLTSHWAPLGEDSDAEHGS